MRFIIKINFKEKISFTGVKENAEVGIKEVDFLNFRVIMKTLFCQDFFENFLSE